MPSCIVLFYPPWISTTIVLASFPDQVVSKLTLGRGDNSVWEPGNEATYYCTCTRELDASSECEVACVQLFLTLTVMFPRVLRQQVPSEQMELSSLHSSISAKGQSNCVLVQASEL